MCRCALSGTQRRNRTGNGPALFELVARYVAIVVFNAVVKLATKYRDIESALKKHAELPGKTVCCMYRIWYLTTALDDD